mmetsp:Transcript_37624/g.60233  ORF Transcript_37624/g.60233 Transcript_37624/m.60233 type:complete len:335 (-) Transcript_37624:165-1169(-)
MHVIGIQVALKGLIPFSAKGVPIRVSAVEKQIILVIELRPKVVSSAMQLIECAVKDVAIDSAPRHSQIAARPQIVQIEIAGDHPKRAMRINDKAVSTAIDKGRVSHHQLPRILADIVAVNRAQVQLPDISQLCRLTEAVLASHNVQEFAVNLDARSTANMHHTVGSILHHQLPLRAIATSPHIVEFLAVWKLVKAATAHIHHCIAWIRHCGESRSHMKLCRIAAIEIVGYHLLPLHAVRGSPHIIVESGEILAGNDVHIRHVVDAVVKHDVIGSRLPLTRVGHELPFTRRGIGDALCWHSPHIVVENRLRDVLWRGRRITAARHPNVARVKRAH